MASFFCSKYELPVSSPSAIRCAAVSPKRNQRPKRDPAAEARFQALLGEAVGCLRGDDASRARGLLVQCLAIKPQHFDCLHLLGVAHLHLGALGEAVVIIESALALRPEHAPAHFNLGLALGQQGLHQAAADAYERALALDPRSVQAWNNRGNELKQLGQRDLAVDCFMRAVACDPGYAEAHFNLGVMYLESKQYPLAITEFRAALHVRPEHPSAWTNLGNAQSALGYHHEALQAYDRALSVDPDFYAAHYNRGLAQRAVGDVSQAITSFETALRINPAQAEGWCSLGVVLQDSGQPERALSCYDRSLSIDPSYAKAAWNKAQVLLLMGHFEEGWRLYEWRWRDDEFTSPLRGFGVPLWLGQFGLKGKSILLHAEQGLGDAIQFARYAQLVKALGATSVLLEVPTPLVSLMNHVQGIDQVIPRGTVLPEFDCHCPLMSLPHALRQPRPWSPSNPYVRPSGACGHGWGGTIGERAALRVGLVWSGAPKHANDRLRSIPLSRWERLLSLTSLEWVSINYRVSEQEGRLLQTYQVQEWGTQCSDFLDLSAALEQIDLLITVDSAPAHLAGSIGMPVWTLLPHSPDYRWLLNRSDTPWYPSMRLFRQKQRGDWDGVFEELALELNGLQDRWPH